MAYVAILESRLENIAEAIRYRGGTSDKYLPKEMAEAIRNIPLGDADTIVNKSIESFSSSIETVGDYIFYNCSKLTTLNLPNVTGIGSAALAQYTKFEKISAFEKGEKIAYLPKILTFGNSCCRRNTVLKEIDLALYAIFDRQAFDLCYALEKVILRDETQISELVNINAFNATPIASGEGYIYVPAQQLEEYKTATNWITYAAQFRAIEDYPEETEVTE